MQAVNHQDLIDAGLPEPLAVEVALAIHAQWVADNKLPDAMRLIRAGCIPIVADDLVHGIIAGRVHPNELSILANWPRAVGERINSILDELVAARDRRISECRKGVAA